MEHRMGQFGFGWKDTTAVQTYTVHDFHPQNRMLTVPERPGLGLNFNRELLKRFGEAG